MSNDNERDSKNNTTNLQVGKRKDSEIINMVRDEVRHGREALRLVKESRNRTLASVDEIDKLIILIRRLMGDASDK